MNHTTLGAAITAALLACATPSAAQDSFSTRGFVLGAHLNTTALQIDEDGGSKAERGFGAGVLLGYGFNDRISAFARLDGASINYDDDLEEDGSYAMGIADLGARYSFCTPGTALRPYVEGGLSGTAISEDVALDGETYSLTFSGPGVFIGGGVEYFFQPKAALDAGLILGKGRFTTAEIDGDTFDEVEDLDFTSIRLSVGITFRP
jgi:hypothetical protein